MSQLGDLLQYDPQFSSLLRDHEKLTAKFFFTPSGTTGALEAGNIPEYEEDTESNLVIRKESRNGARFVNDEQLDTHHKAWSLSMDERGLLGEWLLRMTEEVPFDDALLGLQKPLFYGTGRLQEVRQETTEVWRETTGNCTIQITEFPVHGGEFARFTLRVSFSTCTTKKMEGLPSNGTVTIIEPSEELYSFYLQSVSFQGAATTPIGSDYSSSLVWTSSLDGIIGTGASFSVSNLTLGYHTITASVEGVPGFTATAQTAFRVHVSIDDLIEDAAFGVWSVGRRIYTPYSGDLLEVFRPSDSSYLDVGFDANGDLDEAAIESFLSETGYVTTLYDQFGSGDFLAASTSPASAGAAVLTDASGAVLKKTPNSKPVCQPGTTASKFMLLSSGAGGYTSLTATEMFFVLQRQVNIPAAGDDGLGHFGSDADGDEYPDNADSMYYLGMGSTARKSYSSAVNGSAGHILNVVSTADEWSGYTNGILEYTTPTNTVGWPSGRVQIGTFDFKQYQGYWAELWWFKRKLTSDERDAVNQYIAQFYGMTLNELNTSPEIEITAPVDGAEPEKDADTTFTAEATDAEDGDISENVSWSSDVGGSMGTGASIVNSSLAYGAHTITATVQDAEGIEVTDSIDIEIVAPPLTPDHATLLANLQLWLKASFFSGTISDGNNIGSTEWADQSPQGNNANKSSSSSPIYHATGIGGSPSLECSSSNQRMALDSTIDLGLGESFTVIAVVSVTSDSMLMGNSGANKQIRIDRSGGNNLSFYGGFEVFSEDMTPVDHSDVILAIWRYDADEAVNNQSKFRVNNTNLSTASGNGPGTMTLNELFSTSFDPAFVGHVGEILVYDRFLIDAECKSLKDNYFDGIFTFT